MKHATHALFAIFLAITCGTTALAQGPGATAPGAPAASENPLQVALLKWYKADQVARFPVGNQPYGICFDGANIWVANYADATVSKLRASDGATLGTFTVGFGPYGVAFDGANVWFADLDGNAVSKF